MKIAIYARKSRTTDKGDSIENQITLCKQYADIHFDNPEFIEYRDEGYSGGNTNRPAFQELIKNIKKGGYEVLICYRLDRISRNVLDFSSTLEMITKNNIAFVSIKENFDTTTPMGRAMLHISSVFAQLERETIAERIRDNMLELSKTGRWLGGTLPVGYTSKKTTYETPAGKTKNFTILEIDIHTAPIVTTIFNKYLQLGSLSQLESYLIHKNIKTVNDNYFHPHVLRSILANPVYCPADESVYKYFTLYHSYISNTLSEFNGQYGLMVYNKNRKGKSIYRNNISEWIIAIGKHKPLINSEKWLKVQSQLDKNSIKAIPHNLSTHALLSGLIYCSNCGALMKVTNQAILKDGTTSYIYRCSNKLKSHGTLCNIPNVKGHFLDRTVVDKIKALLLNEAEITKKIIQKHKSPVPGHLDLGMGGSNLKEQIEKAERAIRKMIRLMAQTEDPFLEQSYKNEVNRFQKELDTLNKAFTELQAKENQHADDIHNTDIIAASLKTSIEYIDKASLSEKRILLKSIIKYIEWDGKSVTVYLYRTIEDFESSKRNSHKGSKISYEEW